MDVCAIVLAAGDGQRMRSKRAKAAHRAAGKPLVRWVADALAEAGVADAVFVVGHLADQVREALGAGCACVVQEPRRGTGDAVRTAAGFLEGRTGTVLVLPGDTPLLRAETVRALAACREATGAAAVVAAAKAPDAAGYGRIARGVDGCVEAVVEDEEASGAQRAIREVNAGMYAFEAEALRGVLGRLEARGPRGVNLADAIALLAADGQAVDACPVPCEEILAVDDRVQLQQAAAALNRRICEAHMRAGATILDPATTWIEASVRIAPDAEILPGCSLEGATEIGEDCVVGPSTRLRDAVLEPAVEADRTVVVGSRIGARTHLGPFCYVRPGSTIGSDCRIGDFVEVKNATIGHHTNAAHLAYIGDADLADNVNYGCGSITVNYDGAGKYRTTIGSGAFIGSNSNLVAPVTIADDAYVAAGSTITADVPSFALAIARGRQEVKEGWVLKKGRVRKRKG